MELPLEIKTKVSLVLASYSDLVHNGIFYNNKTFFIKDLSKGVFTGIYKLPYNNYLNSDKEINEYWNSEILWLLQNRMIYKVSVNNRDSLNFRTQLMLTKASEFDFFNNPNSIKLYKEYYVVDVLKNTITGPELTSELSSKDLIKGLTLKGIIYVINTKQTFEPILTSKSA